MSESSGLRAGRTTIDVPVHLALLGVQMSFGGFHVVAKTLIADLPPLAFAGLRVAIATPVLLALAWRKDRCVPSRGDMPTLALLGLLGVCLNQILFILGLQYTSATNAAILMPSIPVFAVAAAAVLGIERVGWRRISGIALAILGALVLLGPGHTSQTSGSRLGNLLILLNCLSFATFLVLQRPILARLPWRTTIAWSFLFGSLPVLGFAAADLNRLDWGTLGGGTWTGLAYIIALPTIFSYTVNTWAVKRSSPTLAATYTTAQPLFAALLAAWLLGEHFGWREAAGFLLIVAGLLRVSWQRQGPTLLPDHE